MFEKRKSLCVGFGHLICNFSVLAKIARIKWGIFEFENFRWLWAFENYEYGEILGLVILIESKIVLMCSI
ncbi:unnamed protein product [Blepharisma stoltei]|uniref:Uncharacterized protein n=1 Tax=Blepharisma stoltei TaxID=1481888 RepID=A0AAU9K2W3_9CILI|nr:unnamed protein product [Blepharisma stoltei]